MTDGREVHTVRGHSSSIGMAGQINQRRTQEGGYGAKAPPPEIPRKKLFTHSNPEHFMFLQFVQRSQFHNHVMTIVYID